VLKICGNVEFPKEEPVLAKLQKATGTGGVSRMTATRCGATKLAKNDEYDIKKSKEKIGPLYPVLKSADGQIIDGKHRKLADKDWPECTVNIKGDAVLIARIVANVQRREVSPKEKTDMLKELAEATHWTPEQIAENSGMSISWVRKYLPSEFKNGDMAKLASKKHEKTRKTVSAKELPVCPSCKSEMILVRVCEECGEMMKVS
jgi:ribosomal protein L32